MEKLQMYFIEISEIFGYKYDDFFFDYLKSISKPNTSKCGKEIIKGEGGWKCEDCELDTYSIYCNNCFTKEKHKNHKVYFNPSGIGFCDCGDNSVIKPEGFCDKHKGDFDNMKDLKNFIKSSIPENLLYSINNVLNKIFLLFIEKIKDISNLNDEIKENEIYKMFDCLEIFCDKLSQNNLSLFYFVTLKFTENFPYETKHKCFYYDENKNLVTFIKKENDKSHICICPFMQVMIYILMRRNTRQNSSAFFNLFLQTYKNKIITSLCLLNSFSELFHNKNLNSFTKMGYQLMNEMGIIVYQEQNIPFLQVCYEEIYSTCKFFLTNKEYEKLSSIYYGFYEIVEHLPSTSIFDKINSNYTILKIIIDICCLTNNSNIFENKINFNSFQRKGYIYELLEIEIYSLLSIICLLKIINFDNKETVNFISDIILEKLIEIKKDKNNTKDKSFSPHLIISKYYTLFLNRFCFNHSVKNKCDLLDSFNYFQNIYPKSKELNIFLFEELLNFFGFMISQLYSFFAYYGPDMIEYYLNYFSISFNLFKIDITLMKYLLSQPEIKKQFNLEKILSLTDIDSSNEFLRKILFENLDINQANINNKEEKYLIYINSVIEYLYLIIRDNLSMENIAFRSVEFKFKIKDDIYEQLYQREKEKINDLIKNEIIHFILGNKNLVKREDCMNYLEKIYNNKYVEIVDKVLKEDCEKISLTNSLVEFSLKKQILNLCDIDNIIDFKNRKYAIEYMTNFQSKDCNLLNISIIEPLNIQKNLTKQIYQTFYNEKNISELIKFYNIIFVYKEKLPSINKVFYFNLTKILSFGYKLCFTGLLEEDFKMKLLEKINQIQNKEFFNNLGENKEKCFENNDNKKDSRKNLKEKLRKKFDKKNESLKDKIVPANMIIEEEIQKEGEECVYCRQQLNKNNNNLECYGKICYYFSDYLTDIFRKKPEDKRKKARKFVTCNHKMHFKCFNEFICLHLNNDENEFECPLCKKLSNIILFDFSSLLKNNCNIIKGINFDKETIDLNEFYKCDKDNKYQILFLSNILSFENYCTKLSHKEFLINDLENDEKLAGKIFNLIIEDFEEFTIYYSKTNNKKEQIDIWKNILYNIRLLLQYKILNLSDNILQLFNIVKLEFYENFEELFTNFPFCYIVNKYIITSFILFESNEENRQKIKNIFRNKILLYLFCVAFIKNNTNETFEEFLSNNKMEFKKLLELFNLKYRICLSLFDEKEENLNLNISIEEVISLIKSNSDIINSINLPLIKKKNLQVIIKEQYLDIPGLLLIDIPESGIEFFHKANGDCFYCHKKYLYSYFCLLCGKKICNSTICLVENKSKGKKEYSLIYHSKKCSGGNGLFLSITDSEIVYILKRRIIFSKIFVYMNNFGEPLNDKCLNEDFKLNKSEYQKAITKYIDMTYRKKSHKY